MRRNSGVQLRERTIPILYDSGFTTEEIATVLGLSLGGLGTIRKRIGLDIKQKTKCPDEEVCEHFRTGKTQEEIGQIYGVTRARIQQILAKNGLSRNSGGATQSAIVAGMNRQKALREAWDTKTQSIYGCSADLLDDINKGIPRSRVGSPAQIYIQQRQTALSRGIGWEISLPEWWQIWQDSGKWEERGRHRDSFVMARLGDIGPYKVGNVYITTLAKNASDSYLTKPAAARQALFVRHPKRGLSPRQQEAAEFMKRGVTHIEAAKLWGTTRETAWNHFNAAKNKLAVAT